MIFILLTPAEETLEPLVQKTFADNHLQLAPGQWLLSVDGFPTSMEVWTKLVAGQEPVPTGIVFPVANGYYGLAPSSVWEWITVKRQATVPI
jgi:hypothetical protein